MDVIGRFAELMDEPTPPLDMAMALVASACRPDVDPDALVARLDVLSAALDTAGPTQLCAALFGDGPGQVGFRGDRVDYFDPANSLLDQVLERRVGIPITLSVVGIEVGRRRGVELHGIGMPGHFLLGEPSAGRYFDAFDGGRSLDVDGARAVFHAVHGLDQPFEREFLAPVSATMIVVRVLNNLRAARSRRGDRAGLATAMRLQAAVPGIGRSVLRDLAGVLAADGRFIEAAEVHEAIARSRPDDADEHVHAATHLRARLN